MEILWSVLQFLPFYSQSERCSESLLRLVLKELQLGRILCSCPGLGSSQRSSSASGSSLSPCHPSVLSTQTTWAADKVLLRWR